MIASIILPAILIGGGDHRHARSGLDQVDSKPDVYERIGEMGEEEIPSG